MGQGWRFQRNNQCQYIDSNVSIMVSKMDLWPYNYCAEAIVMLA